MTKFFALPQSDLFPEKASGERAQRWLAAKATPGTATLFTKKELFAGWPGEPADELEDAIEAFLKTKQLWRIERGKTVFYLHAASVAPLLVPPTRPKNVKRNRMAPPISLPASPTKEAPAPDRIRRAYGELTRETGFSDVLISDLQKHAGVALEELKPWLVQESRAGRALPTRGDWSIADAEARAAAIEIGREPHLRVRLVEKEKPKN